MAEFKLGRLKFVWKGAWASAATFVKDDIINYGGKSYVCTQGHVANADFYHDADLSYWELMNDGYQWKGEWDTTTWYKEGDVVSHGGKAYIALNGHDSGASVDTFYDALDDDEWQLLNDGIQWKGAWGDGEWYKLGDLIRIGGKSYVCTTGHTSTSTFEADTSNWQLFNDGFRWRNTWTSLDVYELNDIVAFGGGTYICIDAHTAGGSFDETKWNVFNSAFEFEDSWNDTTEYQTGDVVSYGGYTYVALERNTDVIPVSDISKWKPFLEGFNFREAWNQTTALYNPGDVVTYGGNTYLCTQTTDAAQSPENTGYWQVFATGVLWRNEWATTNRYRIGDLVKYGASTYYCISPHDPSSLNSPEADTEHVYWRTFADGSASAVVTTQGDLVYRDSVGVQRLAIGELGPEHADHEGTLHSVQPLLVVNPAGTEPEWSKTAHVGVETIHVDNHVVVGPDDGADSASVYIGINAQSYLSNDSQFEGYVGLTDVKLLAVSDVEGFGQIAFKNINSGTTSSTDMIMYTDDGDNDSGWIDMGITSSTFDITSGFGITGQHDGYIFMNAPVGSSGLGNLVIATGENGSERDIVFVTGGFDPTTNTNAEKLRIVGSSTNAASFTASISGTTLTVTNISDGNIIFDGTGTIVGIGVVPGTTIVAQLTGTAGSTGTYTVSQSQTLSSRAITQFVRQAGVDINLDTASINPYTGALRVAGGVGVRGDLNLLGEISADGGAIYQGVGAKRLTEDDYPTVGTVALTNASGIFTGDADDFVQFALKNHNSGTGASTDIIAYSSNGDNDSGWIDMGITSENYDDETFAVTGPSTGYIFMSAPAGSTSSGDLLIGTDETGTQNDIIIFSNGFDGGNERLRIIGEPRVGHAAGVEVLAPTESISTTTGALRVNGGIGLLGNMNVGGNINITGTITIGGEGSSVQTTSLAVSDPMIKMGKGNNTDILDLGFYGQYSSANTSLNADVNASATTLDVVSTAAFTPTGVLIIGDETITYTGKTSTTFTGCTRGAAGSTAASYLSGASVYIPVFGGLVRDATDGVYKLFSNLLTTPPSTTVDFSAADLAYGNIRVNNITAAAIDGANIGVTTRGTGAFTTLAANSTVTLSGETSVSNTFNVQQISETLNTKTAATGVVTHDWATGAIWYHSSISGNFTPNITNLPTTENRALTISLVLNQGGAGYYPSALQVGGNAVSIRWVGGTTPVPSTSKIDVCVFTLIRTGSTWYALGDYTKYA